MEFWMYLVVIGMILVALIGTVWITLWTIQRGERANASRPEQPTRQSEQGVRRDE